MKKKNNVMKIVIRDDDLSFYSDPEELVSLYGSYYGRIPVSFGVVPYVNELVPVHPKALYRETMINAGEKKYDIAENKALVDYINKGIEKKYFYLALHGFDHKYLFKKNLYIGECLWKKEETLNKELKNGKKYLEQLFGQKLEVFIPPDNAISQKCINALLDLNINKINSTLSLRTINRRLSFKYLSNFLKRLFYKISHFTKVYSIYPGLLFFNRHRERSAVLFHSYMTFEQVKSIIEMYKAENVDSLIVVIHHKELIKNQQFLEEFKKMLDYLLTLDSVKFVSLKEVFYE